MFYKLVLIAPLLSGIALPAAQRPAAHCAEYYETRIAYLLGCCGDQPIAEYPGPAFPYAMGEVELASQALKEIELAGRSRCYTSGSATAKTLALNSVGAHLMRARARSHSASASDLNAAVRDTQLAAHELRSFVISYPESAVRIWYWIAMSFRRAGQPWEALRFVIALPESCCTAGEREAFLGDIYFDLAVFDAAAERYSLWLKASASQSICGHANSTKNADELRSRGFRLPPVRRAEGVCGSLGDWHPYAGVPN